MSEDFGEVYQKTNELRIVNRIRHMSVPMDVGADKALQQAWISQQNGKVKWIDVPVGDEAAKT